MTSNTVSRGASIRSASGAEWPQRSPEPEFEGQRAADELPVHHDNRRAEVSTPFMRPQTVRNRQAHLSVERLPDLAGQGGEREGLLDEVGAWAKNAPVHDRAVGVARRVEHLRVAGRERTRSASSRPLIFGMTTSVSSRWIGPPWLSTELERLGPSAAPSTV